MKLPLASAALTALLLPRSTAADSHKTHHSPCTIRSHSTGTFFDLNPMAVLASDTTTKGWSKKVAVEPPHSWRAKGYNYPANFTLNFCAPVVEELKNVVGVERGLWGNVSAYYEMNGKVYSLGNMNTEPVIQGRALLLNYTNGSPCPARPAHTKRQLSLRPASLHPFAADADDDDNHNRKKPSKDDKHDVDDDDRKKKPGKGKDDDDNDDDHPVRRKSALIHLLCDRDPLAAKVSLAFLGTLDECTYAFAARSRTACGGVPAPEQTLSPAAVFGIIALVAVLVYLVGGCVYSRTVLHQRGWKQLPNYSLWRGCFDFVVDMFVIATSSCMRLLPGRRGYGRVSLGNDRHQSGHGRGRNSSEAENRLIDQLDEEWED